MVLAALATPPNQGELIVFGIALFLISIAILLPINRGNFMASINVPLDNPIQRGDQTITDVTVRKPAAGELRGLTLQDIGSIKVDTMIKLLPRITSPNLTEAECAAMDPADFTALSVEVAGFLLQTAKRPDSPA
jgi:hypothetical protein